MTSLTLLVVFFVLLRTVGVSQLYNIEMFNNVCCLEELHLYIHHLKVSGINYSIFEKPTGECSFLYPHQFTHLEFKQCIGIFMMQHQN